MALSYEHIGYHKQVGMKALFDVLAPASEDYALARAIDPDRLPAHIAIIMDGNGRWAKRRRLPRAAGHRAGVPPVRSTVETCARLGLRALTLYAFSVENWKRPRAEVETLWRLLRRYLRGELDLMHRHDIRFTAIGRLDALPDFVREELDSVIRSTAGNKGLQLNLAINYGGRAEIVDAVAALVDDARSGKVIIDEAAISARLYTAGMPDPDLLIRTSGEMRVSNFLLWQIAYAELYVTETLWPDFSRAELMRAILDYQKRDRRFGGLGPSSLADAAREERASEHAAENTLGHGVQPNQERNADPDVESGAVETVGVPSR
jgi:undecaprenyl diphosphate synthase